MSRAEIIETMADGIRDAIDADGSVSADYAASAALTALQAEGMAVVPVAYTPQMFEAGDRVLEDDGGPGEIWSAMLAAHTQEKDA